MLVSYLQNIVDGSLLGIYSHTLGTLCQRFRYEIFDALTMILETVIVF